MLLRGGWSLIGQTLNATSTPSLWIDINVYSTHNYTDVLSCVDLVCFRLHTLKEAKTDNFLEIVNTIPDFGGLVLVDICAFSWSNIASI